MSEGTLDRPGGLGGVNRRMFLRGAGLLALGTVGASLLEACSSPAPATPTSAPAAATAAPKPTTAPAAAPSAAASVSSSPAVVVGSPSAVAPAGSPAPAAAGPVPTSPTVGGVKLPTFVPFAGPTPDLPGDARGLDPAYTKYPSNLVKTVPQPFGTGQSVSGITYLTLSAPPPMDQNTAWQAINKAMGVTLNLEEPAAADYPARVNVLLAGNDLPDFIYNPTTANPYGIIPAVNQFAQQRCVDLTPYLSGDAVKAYPNLAAYPTYTWRSSLYNGKMYALPIARAPIGSVAMYREDLFEKAGVPLTNAAPQNGDDFKKMLQAVNQPNSNQWAIASNATWNLTPNGVFTHWFRVPNNWRLNADGTLTKDFETDEWKAAVGYARDLWQMGLWHPNTPNYGGAYNNDFMAGRFAVALGVWGQYVQLWDIEATIDPNAKLYPMHPWAIDGGKPIYQAGSGQFGVTFMKQQSSPDNIKTLLNVANFFAAPFGSQEWELNYFGVKGTDFNYNAVGAPVLTDQGNKELSATWRYIGSPPYAVFSSHNSQDFATLSHSAEAAMIDVIQYDPTIGLYSQTAFQQGVPAQDTLIGGASDIIQGRRPITDLDSLLSDWRNAAGNKMRSELQDALAAANK